MRRYDNLSTYVIDTNHGKYAVTMERIKNTPDGGPRFKALITNIAPNESDTISPFVARNTYVYTFKGHYMSDEEEAKWVLERHEEEITKK